MNMLRFVEVVNTKDTVWFPVNRTVTMSTESDALALVQSMKKAGIEVSYAGNVVGVKLRSRDEVNQFAEVYFPLLFVASRAEAKVNDAKIRRTMKDILSGTRPAPHTVSVEAGIRSVTARLNTVGVLVSPAEGDVSVSGALVGS